MKKEISKNSFFRRNCPAYIFQQETVDFINILGDHWCATVPFASCADFPKTATEIPLKVSLAFSSVYITDAIPSYFKHPMN